MATKIKGIYKSFKYITHIFVVKEREMEIGCPTDVKHVAHIGWDDPSGTGPSWMNEFKNAPDFSTSIGTLGERKDPNPMPTTRSCATRALEEPTGIPSTGVGHVPKKHKRKKAKTLSSPKPSSRQSRTPRPKAAAMCCDRKSTPITEL